MTRNSFSTPLSAIDGVALDTETTGLDSRSARVVQIGAVRVEGGRMDADRALELLINPGIAIPPETTAIHGITDDKVRSAPAFAEIADDLRTFIGHSIVIGHTIGFDLAVLAREAQLAGVPWTTTPSLDVRMLAELALPTLAHYDLDRIAKVLGIEIEGRHTALGDAKATAQIYAALLPHLRQRNIRTLAEADSALRALADRQAAAQAAPALATTSALGDRVSVLSRVDSFPYRHRLADVMSAHPVWADALTSVSAAMRLMIDRRISSLLVGNPDNVAGIVTERDLLRRIDKLGAAGLDSPIGEIQSRPLQALPASDFVYRAIGRIERLRFRHLGVSDVDGNVVGMVTTHDLLRHRATTAIILGDEIDAAETVAQLGSAWAKLPVMARALLSEDVDPRTVAAVISTELCALTRRAAELGKQRLAAEGLGAPPVPYALLVLGSGGRGESLLAADQDNAIVFASGQEGGPEDKWFEKLGVAIADILDEVGVPYCKGGVMAKNAQWRHSVEDWIQLVDNWVRRQRPQDLLNVDIFFDGIVVHGDRSLGETVIAHAFAAAGRSKEFHVQLSELARQWRAPLTLFGGLKGAKPDGRLDAKKGGLFPLVSAARALAIKHGIRAPSTAGRYRALPSYMPVAESDIDDLMKAHRTLLGAVLAQQLRDTEIGIPLSPRVDLRRLAPEENTALKAAIGSVSIAIDLVREGRS